MKTVQILAFDDMEVLDFAGPYEVFNVAGELSSPSAFSVSTVGVSARPVGRGGFTVVPDHQLDDAPVPDILVIPGGAGSRALVAGGPVVPWLRQRATEVDLILTVCTGSLVAAKAGLLDNLPATTHHTAFDALAEIAPTVDVRRGPRFVRSAEGVWTSAGVSAGVDLCLHAVLEIAGPQTHASVVEEMEWMWDDQAR